MQLKRLVKSPKVSADAQNPPKTWVAQQLSVQGCRSPTCTPLLRVFITYDTAPFVASLRLR